MKTLTIQYSFTAQDCSEIIDLELDAQTLELMGEAPASSPSWTKLDFHQCAHCPLSVQTHPYCPLTVHIEACESDAAINAVVLLDLYTEALPLVIENSLDEIRYLFNPFLK